MILSFYRRRDVKWRDQMKYIISAIIFLMAVSALSVDVSAQRGRRSGIVEKNANGNSVRNARGFNVVRSTGPTRSSSDDARAMQSVDGTSNTIMFGELRSARSNGSSEMVPQFWLLDGTPRRTLGADGLDNGISAEPSRLRGNRSPARSVNRGNLTTTSGSRGIIAGNWIGIDQ